MSKLFSDDYTRYSVGDEILVLPLKGDFVTIDYCESPTFQPDFELSAEYYCEPLDGELIPHLQKLAETCQSPQFVSLWSRRYACITVTLTDDFINDNEIEAVLVHHDGVLQAYPGGLKVSPDDIQYYEVSDYGDDCLGYHGEKYMLHQGKVYKFDEVAE